MQYLENLKPIAKALVGAAVTAAAPIIINLIQTQAEGLVVVVVGAVVSFLGGLAVWAKSN